MGPLSGIGNELEIREELLAQVSQLLEFYGAEVGSNHDTPGTYELIVTVKKSGDSEEIISALTGLTEKLEGRA